MYDHSYLQGLGLDPWNAPMYLVFLFVVLASLAFRAFPLLGKHGGFGRRIKFLKHANGAVAWFAVPNGAADSKPLRRSSMWQFLRHG